MHRERFLPTLFLLALILTIPTVSHAGIDINNWLRDGYQEQEIVTQGSISLPFQVPYDVLDSWRYKNIFGPTLPWERSNIWEQNTRRARYEEALMDLATFASYEPAKKRMVILSILDGFPEPLKHTPLYDYLKVMLEQGENIDLDNPMSTVNAAYDEFIRDKIDPMETASMIEQMMEIAELTTPPIEKLVFFDGIPLEDYDGPEEWGPIMSKLKVFCKGVSVISDIKTVVDIKDREAQIFTHMILMPILANGLALERIQRVEDAINSNPTARISTDPAFQEALANVKGFLEKSNSEQALLALGEQWKDILKTGQDILSLADIKFTKILLNWVTMHAPTPLSKVAVGQWTAGLMVSKYMIDAIITLTKQVHHLETSVAFGNIAGAMGDTSGDGELKAAQWFAAMGGSREMVEAYDESSFLFSFANALVDNSYARDNWVWSHQEAMTEFEDVFFPTYITTSRTTCAPGDTINLQLVVNNPSFAIDHVEWITDKEGAFGDTAAMSTTYTPTEEGQHELGINVDIGTTFIYRKVLITVDSNAVPGEPEFQDIDISPDPLFSDTSAVISGVYHDDDLDAVDAGSVKVVIDGTEYAMTGGTASGSLYTCTVPPLSPGNHDYHFIGAQSGTAFRYPVSAGSSFTLKVEDADVEGLRVTANPAVLSICDQGSSRITARLVVDGEPQSGVEIAFVILEGSGNLSDESAWTDADGQASVTYSPQDEGSATIGAIKNGYSIAQVEVETGDCAVNITPTMYLDDCSDTYAKYQIDALVETLGTSPEPVQNHDVKVYLRDTQGNLWGSLYDYDGNIGNPVTTSTDHNGKISVFIDSSETRDVVVEIECMGTVRTIQNSVGGSCPVIADVQPFLTIPHVDYVGDPRRMVDVSPDGTKLAVAYNREVRIYKLDFGNPNSPWTHWHTLLQPDERNEYALCVAWSPDGNYLATGWEDPDDADDPALMLWNVGPETTDYSLRFSRMTSSSYEDVRAIAWKPDSTALMTVEAYISGIGGRVRYWNLSGTNIWTSTQAGDDGTTAVWGPSYAAAGFERDDSDKSYFWLINSGYSVNAVRAWDDDHVNALAFSPDGSKLAVGSNDRSAPINVYSTSGTQIGSFAGHPDEIVYGLDWNPDNGKLVSCGNSIAIWKSTGANEIMFGTNGAIYQGVRWTPSGDIIAATSGNIYLFAPYDTQGPALNTVTRDGAEFTTETGTVEGSTTDPHIVKSLTISVNGGATETVPLNDDGTFAHAVSLEMGESTLTLVSTDGAGNTTTESLTVSRVVASPDFNIEVVPGTWNAKPGVSVDYEINTSVKHGFASDVTLSLLDGPAGLDFSFSQSTVTAGASTTLTLTPEAALAVGGHVLTLQATGGGKTHEVEIEIHREVDRGGVELTASASVPAAALWRDSEGIWMEFGDTDDSIPVGTRTIEFRPVEGYGTPTPVEVSVGRNTIITLNASYATDDDNDNDGIPDDIDTDDDNDGIPDVWEIRHNLDPLDASDAGDDNDGDDATNLEEYQGLSDPNSSASLPGPALTEADVVGTWYSQTGLDEVDKLIFNADGTVDFYEVVRSPVLYQHADFAVSGNSLNLTLTWIIDDEEFDPVGTVYQCSVISLETGKMEIVVEGMPGVMTFYTEDPREEPVIFTFDEPIDWDDWDLTWGSEDNFEVMDGLLSVTSTFTDPTDENRSGVVRIPHSSGFNTVSVDMSLESLSGFLWAAIQSECMIDGEGNTWIASLGYEAEGNDSGNVISSRVLASIFIPGNSQTAMRFTGDIAGVGVTQNFRISLDELNKEIVFYVDGNEFARYIIPETLGLMDVDDPYDGSQIRSSWHLAVNPDKPAASESFPGSCEVHIDNLRFENNGEGQSLNGLLPALHLLLGD